MTIEAGRSDVALPHVVKAGGSGVVADDVSHPERQRRLRLLLEVGIIFVLAPVLIRNAVFNWHIPLPLVLQPVLVGFMAYLLWDPTFTLRKELLTGFRLRTLLSILALFALVGGVVTLWVMILLPHRFLELPAQMPALWLAIMIFYPLVSVIPQELIYRTFFFHRYGPLFNSRRLAIVVNAALFGFAHLIFGSYVSIVLTALLGGLVAWRYDETRSFWAVWLEHSLYGCLVFTVGLGHYFFTGISTLN